MSVSPTIPVPSAKNTTGDFDAFTDFARRVVSVPHSQIKAQLDAEKAAKTDVRRIDRETAMRILTALDRFARTGESDVKALQGRDEFRFQITDYRLFFINIADALEVRRVLHRREAYRVIISLAMQPYFQRGRSSHLEGNPA